MEVYRAMLYIEWSLSLWFPSRYAPSGGPPRSKMLFYSRRGVFSRLLPSASCPREARLPIIVTLVLRPKRINQPAINPPISQSINCSTINHEAVNQLFHIQSAINQSAGGGSLSVGRECEGRGRGARLWSSWGTLLFSLFLLFSLIFSYSAFFLLFLACPRGAQWWWGLHPQRYTYFISHTITIMRSTLSLPYTGTTPSGIWYHYYTTSIVN